MFSHPKASAGLYQIATFHLSSCVQVEIKLRLPNSAAHACVAELMGPPTAFHAQENYFFDGVNGELKKKQTLRVRFYNTDQKAVITVKVRCAMPLWARTSPSRDRRWRAILLRA